MIFRDRYQAGELLVKRLSSKKIRGRDWIIAAVPRGGVVVAKAISDHLKIPLTAVVIKKLGAPNNEELAIGATASHGSPVLDRWLVRDLEVSADWLKKEIIKKKKEAASREKFLGVRLLENTFENKNVIVVDDGLATGQTARAAAKTVRELGAKKLVLAVSCASPGAIDLVREDYDEVICLEVSSDLFAVGQFYKDFRPIEDSEVKTILSDSNQN